MFKGLAGIATIGVGLAITGWGLWHVHDAPIPTRTFGGFGHIQYATNAQLKAVAVGLFVVFLGALAFWSAVTPKPGRKGTRRKRPG